VDEIVWREGVHGNFLCLLRSQHQAWMGLP
jgi:hypothetical protein